jgi:hypothetical protein
MLGRLGFIWDGVYSNGDCWGLDDDWGLLGILGLLDWQLLGLLGWQLLGLLDWQLLGLLGWQLLGLLG